MRTKRLEYKNGTIMVDKELEETIREKSNVFVNDILSNIGKKYLIPDVEQVILRYVMFAIIDRQTFEYFDIDRDADD